MIYNNSHMGILSTTSRQTRYVNAVYGALQELKHSTNLELQHEVQKTYPEVSATTVHRVSGRLKERGLIGTAPKPANGSERYDSSVKLHHHFMCIKCGRLCDVPDTPEGQIAIKQLAKLSRDCAISGSLTLQGICKKCVTKEDI